MKPIIASALVGHGGNVGSTRMELDSHANMPVVGSQCYVLAESGRTANVNSFHPDAPAVDLKIIDCAIKYDCPYNNKCYIMIIRNALHVPSMTNHLIAPFILREAGIHVNDRPKIHAGTPTLDDHSILFPAHNLRIPLSLHGIFSFFTTSKPTLQDLRRDDVEVVALTPDGFWNPNDESYALNEDAFLDWQGDLVLPSVKTPRSFDLSRVPLDNTLADSMNVSALETAVLDDRYTRQEADPSEYLCDSLVASLCTSEEESDMRMMTGATVVFDNNFLFDMPSVSASPEPTDNIPLGDDYFVSSMTASLIKGVTPDHHAKIWRIDHDTAKRTIDMTTQHCVRQSTDSLSRNYLTND